MIVGGGFAEGLRIGCRWGLGLVERKIHLRTLSPVVCTDRIVNQGLSSGREEERWLRRGCGGPNLGGTGTAQGSSRRIRGEKPPSGDLIREFNRDHPSQHPGPDGNVWKKEFLPTISRYLENARAV